MQISELFKKKTVFSYEVFPPRSTAHIQTIYNTLDKLHDLNPDFISVTYGAGGSNNCTSSLRIAKYIKKVCGVEAVVHLSGMYITKEHITSILKNFQIQGIENILALRGDKIENKPIGKDFAHANELVTFIKNFDKQRTDKKSFCISGACYPEKHPESKDIICDIQNLKQKTDAGSSYLVSQLFFDNTYFYKFLERARLGGIKVPVEAGIMPVINKRQIEHITRISEVTLPKKFLRILDKYDTSKESLRDAGIAYAVDQIVDLVTNGVQGIHLYTMNNAYVAQKITQATKSLF